MDQEQFCKSSQASKDRAEDDVTAVIIQYSSARRKKIPEKLQEKVTAFAPAMPRPEQRGD